MTLPDVKSAYVGKAAFVRSKLGFDPAMNTSPVGNRVATLWYSLAIFEVGILTSVKKRRPAGAEGR